MAGNSADSTPISRCSPFPTVVVLSLLAWMFCCLFAPEGFASESLKLLQQFGPRRQAFVRIIHQQYKTADQSQWPPEWRALSHLWRAYHPDWEYRFWTDADEAALFRNHLPEFENLYNQIGVCVKAPIAQADLATYAIIYVYGGVYADLDTAPFVKLDEIMNAVVQHAEQPPAVIVNIARPEEDGRDEVRGNGGLSDPFSVDNDFLVSTVPRHAFFYNVLTSIRRFVDIRGSEVCDAPNGTLLYDHMFLTAWGRLSVCARAWTSEGIDSEMLEFFESLYMRDRAEATFIFIVMHLLPYTPFDKLRASPPPTSKKKLEAWVDWALAREEKEELRKRKKHVSSLPVPNEQFGNMRVFVHAPDLLILPIAASPSTLPKQALRHLVLTCAQASDDGANVRCFQAAILDALRKEFPARDARHNLLAVFNQDDGIWEGSWGPEQQAAYRKAAHAVPLHKQNRGEL